MQMIDRDAIFVPAEGIQVRGIDGELIVLDIDQSRFSGINRSGALIWQSLVSGKSPAQVVSVLALQYPGVPHATLERDVLSLTENLIDRGWLKASPTALSGAVAGMR